MNLKYLTDNALLSDTKKLSKEYREVTTQLLYHLKEIENRKLYSELGYSSLFFYVVRELGFDESSASRRIKAARLLADIPEIEKKIENGNLTLSNLAKASDVFRQNDISEPKEREKILEKIEKLSTRECEKTLLEITDRPLPPPKKEIKPISKTLNLLTVTLSQDGTDWLDKLKGLLANRKLSQERFYEIVFMKACLKIESEIFKTEGRGRIYVSTTRNIPNGVKKAVFERDRSCVKCGSSSSLQFDHIIPFSHGGKSELDNLRLLCRNCNLRQKITQKL